MNKIEFYPRISDDIIRDAGISLVGDFSFFYSDFHGHNKELAFEKNENEYYLRDEHYKLWNPKEYNLNIRAVINVKNPDVLFGTNGVSTSESKVKVLLQWMCKKTNLRSLDIYSSLTIEKNQPIENYCIQVNIPKGNIRDSLFINILFVSFDNKKINDRKEFFLEHKDGDVLGEIFHSRVYIEGDGSDFPMQVINWGKNNPLWKLEYNTLDPTEEEFCEEYICIVFNEEHKDFLALELDDFENPSPLFREIFASAICQILIEIKNSNYLDKTISGEGLLEGSICSAMHYFINLYDVDTSSIEKIMLTVRNGIATKI